MTIFVPRQLKRKLPTHSADHGPSTGSKARANPCQHENTQKRCKLESTRSYSASTSSMTTSGANSIYLEEIVGGVELLLSDYNHHQDQENARWFKERERVVDGHAGCSSLSSSPLVSLSLTVISSTPPFLGPGGIWYQLLLVLCPIRTRDCLTKNGRPCFFVFRDME